MRTETKDVLRKKIAYKTVTTPKKIKDEKIFELMISKVQRYNVLLYYIEEF